MLIIKKSYWLLINRIKPSENLSDSRGESSIFYGYGWLFGFFLAVVVGIVIIGGIKGIARVTEKVVPFMGGIYSLAALVIIFINYEVRLYIATKCFPELISEKYVFFLCQPQTNLFNVFEFLL